MSDVASDFDALMAVIHGPDSGAAARAFLIQWGATVTTALGDYRRMEFLTAASEAERVMVLIPQIVIDAAPNASLRQAVDNAELFWENNPDYDPASDPAYADDGSGE